VSARPSSAKTRAHAVRLVRLLTAWPVLFSLPRQTGLISIPIAQTLAAQNQPGAALGTGGEGRGIVATARWSVGTRSINSSSSAMTSRPARTAQVPVC
jgi:hypothetical protein